MSSVNTRTRDHRIDHEVQLAGGTGAPAAVQDAEQQLRRAVMACLLWEDVAYSSGGEVAEEIRNLVLQVRDPAVVARIAIEARTVQHLRHVPLFIAKTLATFAPRAVIADLLPQIILRPDELTEFLALYWQNGKTPLTAGVKLGLAEAFMKFSEYQLAKYNRPASIRLRDVLFMVHAKPQDEVQADLFRRLASNELEVPDTWEVALSRGDDKRKTWERLISEGKLGGLAFLRNLRNMTEADVDRAVMRKGFAGLKADRLLPLNFIAAAKAAPAWLPEIEEAMIRSLGSATKLAGETVLVVDVSGSMAAFLSGKSGLTRLDAASAMAVIAREVCEHVSIWATAGSDSARTHTTAPIPLHRGFALADEIRAAQLRMGQGGIFTRQALEHIAGKTSYATDRTIVFSDSQDCDFPDARLPKPFSKRNYIVDVSSSSRGINYEGLWTSEISGWSEHFIAYIAALETQPQQ